jgi:uncharacterized protein
VRKLKRKAMSKNMADKILSNAIACNNDSVFKVDFFGGEPLLELNLIKHVVSYLKKNQKKNISNIFSLITNGKLIDNELISYLKENDFIVSLSIDVNPEAHNKYRYNKNYQYEDILRKLYLLIDKKVRTKVIITLYPESLQDLDIFIEKMFTKGVDSISISPFISKDWKLSDLNKLFKLYDNLIRISNRFSNKELYIIESNDSSIKKIMTEFTIDENGDVFLCDRLAGIFPEKHSVGNVNSFNFPKLPNLLCSECPVSFPCCKFFYTKEIKNDFGKFGNRSLILKYNELHSVHKNKHVIRSVKPLIFNKATENLLNQY